MKALVILPNQLFPNLEIFGNFNKVYIVEEFFFFRSLKFHKLKIAFHRATMRYFFDELKQKNYLTDYIDSFDELSKIQNLITSLDDQGFSEIKLYNPVDNSIEKKLKKVFNKNKIKYFNNPLFINSDKDLVSFFDPNKKTYFQTTFYKNQRKKHNILIDSNSQPTGGKWTYDSENRKKYPKNKKAPKLLFPKECKYWSEALKYTNKYYSTNFGVLSKNPIYPINRTQSLKWFEEFLSARFYDFGSYEDAIVKDEVFLNHSVLSPLINVGLISPSYILERVLDYSNNQTIPINSVEGFIRQILGWREFIRGIYKVKGNYSRNCNFYGFSRKIPSSFYDGSTGIEPVDNTIKKILKTGYCHHIERLMVLGNFMLLCEFHPDEVYRWFMELFIDSYDWVMVPNIYGMSQFADGGVFSTKPYISSSNYIKKMSNFTSGKWTIIWDGLFWNFIQNNQELFKKNPRTSMMYYNLVKMEDNKRKNHILIANDFLKKL